MAQSLSIPRISHSIHLGLRLFFLLFLLLGCLYLGYGLHRVIDCTASKDFTLSELSVKLLDSSLFTKKKRVVTIYALIDRQSPHYKRISHVLSVYNARSKGSIKLSILSPLKQSDAVLQLEKRYGFSYIEPAIIIDASPQKAIDNKHVRYISINNLGIFNAKNKLLAWQDEAVITSQLLSALEGTSRRIYFLADRIDLDVSQGVALWKNLANILKTENIELIPLRLSESHTIPKDAQALIILAPQYEFTKEEIAILQTYWDTPKSAIFCALDARKPLKSLKPFLRNYGVTPRPDALLSVNNGQTLSTLEAFFCRGPELTSRLGGKITRFEGMSSSLAIDENNPRLLNNRIQPLGLIQAAKGWWAESDPQQSPPSYNIHQDPPPPFYLSAAILRGQATSDITANLVSKMVVIANSDFLATGKTHPEQVDFLRASFNWLLGRSELIAITPKPPHLHKITLLESHKTFLTRLLLIFLPASALFLAGIIWNVRRS